MSKRLRNVFRRRPASASSSEGEGRGEGMSKKLRNALSSPFRRRPTSASIMARFKWPPAIFKRITPRTVKELLEFKGASNGNTVKLYFSGSEAFVDMWKAIDQAQHRVWMETYQLNPDRVGNATLTKLTEAARRGCHVVLVYDYVGSYKMRDRDTMELRKENGVVVVFHRLFGSFQFPWKWQFPFYRTHRKILIVDDQVGFCGGLNICDDYAGDEVGGNGRFRDTHCRLQGPCVMDLKRVFLGSVGSTDKQTYQQISKLPSLPEQQQEQQQQHFPVDNYNKFVQILESDVRRNRRHIQQALCLMLKNAKKYCYVTSPYFIPPLQLRNEILKAKARGVDVKIITQGLCRTPLASEASQHIYGLFLKVGIPIYQMYHQELHAKTITIDGIYCSVGTFNMDELSYKHLLEVNVTFLDVVLSEKIDEQFKKDLEESTELTLEKWEKRGFFKKLWHWCVYQIIRTIF